MVIRYSDSRAWINGHWWLIRQRCGYMFECVTRFGVNRSSGVMDDYGSFIET